MQAVTRVNVEHASKRQMRKPTHCYAGEGRWRSGKTSDSTRPVRRGSDDGMHVQGNRPEHGKPQRCGRVTRNRCSVRSRTGPCGVAERPVVVRKPGNAGGAKGP